MGPPKSDFYEVDLLQFLSNFKHTTNFDLIKDAGSVLGCIWTVLGDSRLPTLGFGLSNKIKTSKVYSVKNVGSRLWNDIPDYLKEKGKQLNFKKHIATYYIQSYQ